MDQQWIGAVAELESIERSLRDLVPADLYAALWVDPSPKTMVKVFDHLRTLQHILIDYVPRDVAQQPPLSPQIRHCWHRGTLLFTDLAGFTPLFAANAAAGRAGAEALLALINDYFAQMVELVSKAGGNLLEFTGDAMLVQFRHEAYQSEGDHAEVMQAIYAGLRMQRAMENFAAIETAQGCLSLRMRLGIHPGQFVAADIGTPLRRAHVLLGQPVLEAKRTEGAGVVGRVCLSQAGRDRLQPTAHPLHLEPNAGDSWLVVDDLSALALGEYDLTLSRRRPASSVLFDRSVPGLLSEIQVSLATIEPLASYLPRPVLQLLVNTAAARRISPAFPTAAVAFVNLIGLPEAVDAAYPDDTDGIVACFSQAFALINGAVERRRGILQKVTYHSVGSELLIHFGVLAPDPEAPLRAVETLAAIRALVNQLHPPLSQGQPLAITCRMGLTYGPVFAAEIGEPRGRREFNVLGDTVNTAARLMGRASPNQILLDAATRQALGPDPDYHCNFFGEFCLKGKAAPQPIYSLEA
ncbi:adenylate/guanylate cyclase domain-containing protein [Leptolyngbya sp. CCNP1308]|uniref:adenylate/guanylate cyclase domain-containing protein n=1 Tax=Leptolyngbya sp. CCNP1308 TaxID=3110255 RepID=UPI002B21983D|nr:adenylate/guanylate cyclase domain-containing protein [Leptolyngbya sp. CCNP1308]MEA5447451.1 adenylate/guanylate cyclase domain-containing protein [Leptolyngbya sp. CCNP1308]